MDKPEQPVAQEIPPAAEQPDRYLPAHASTGMAQPLSDRTPSRLPRWADFLLLLILGLAAFFRLSGLYWGEYQYLHPDERFLVWVGTDISPTRMETTINPDSSVNEKKVWIGWGEYFDTPNSPMNPNNRGHGFYVYGTLPMFITRMAVEFVYGHSGFNEMTDIGRALSAVADLLVIILIYAIARRQYDQRVALLASAFYAAMALPIQQAHFFTMDTFINLFTLLALYFAVRISTDRRSWVLAEGDASSPPEPAGLRGAWQKLRQHPLFIPSLGFGLAYGMAVASKLNAAPVAVALPAAVLIRIAALPRAQRSRAINRAIPYVVAAGVMSILVFRLCQPYAFSGPGFFGLKPNPSWIAQLKELRSQSSGDVDFPPAMQWARRDITFSGQNMVKWGMGIPLGALAWIGFVWAGLRMLTQLKKHAWRQHALLWGWTGMYFAWQSLALNPTMRYQLPIYPTLAIFAGWAIIALWDAAKAVQLNRWLTPGCLRAAALIIGGLVLITSYGYAYGFSTIYTRPITRVEASRWIYENIAGPINLPIATETGPVNQLLPVSYDYPISPGYPLQTSFLARASGALREIYIPHLRDNQTGDYLRTIRLTISEQSDTQTRLASATLEANLSPQADPRGEAYTLQLDSPIQLTEGQHYSLQLSVDGTPDQVAVDGDISLAIDTPQTGEPQSLSPGGFILLSSQPFAMELAPIQDGYLTQLTIRQVSVLSSGTQPLTLAVSLTTAEGLIPGEEPVDASQRDTPLATVVGSVTLNTSSTQALDYLIPMEIPLPLTAGQSYRLQVFLLSQQPVLQLAGDSLANEGEWDDGLPLRMDSYDPFGGIYPQGLNFNMYWDDNADKQARFIRILDESDYVVISSNRQWGSLPRMPERFPLTTTYYRALLGCPDDKTIYWCYASAIPGSFQGSLGFELVKVFQSNPKFGPFEINDQFAEEAFTVYDHPKVLVFKKTADYDYETMAAILIGVDLSRVLRIAPMRFPDRPADLMLSPERQTEQRQAGTWSELFNPASLLNRFRPLAVMVWYLCFSLLGWALFPILRHLLPGLPDRGYALARIAGLLIFAYLTWLAGSIGIGYTRPVIAVIYLLLLGIGLDTALKDRHSLAGEIQTRWRYLLMVELLALAFFTIDLLIRFGNPDLWHPWKGGERPMDFSYFNAILKSTAFPPYDPWFAGGYLNYYYFGFVYLGTLVKLLGITPAVGYNLILPTVFSMLGLGAFSIVYNLVETWRQGRPEDQTDWTKSRPISHWFSIISGLMGAAALAVLGNLGTVRMIFQGYQRLAAPDGIIEGAAITARWVWAARGFILSLSGQSLPYSLGDWYWLPSRAIPVIPGDVEPITEFPFFTTIYGDPHAHLFALPITLLVLSWGLAVLAGKMRWRTWPAAIGSLLLGGLAIGALRPTNTWDFYPYLALGSLAVAYPLVVSFKTPDWFFSRLPFLDGIPALGQRILAAVLAILGLVFTAHILFQPFAYWYGLGYSEIDLWTGNRTSLTAYFTHWLVFLFPVIGWMFWETYQWMAATPLSALRRLEPYKNWVIGGLLLLLALIFATMALGAGIAWLVLPLAAWAGILIFRPGMPDVKRFLLFLVGAGLLLTVMVEIIVLVGDIGRMNTVFKFYLQVWTFFSITAAAALAWLWLALSTWKPGWRNFFQISMVLLVGGAVLYPMMAGTAKVKDRMAMDAPHTLDGMAYMEYARYGERWGEMDLSQDYHAVEWLLQNAKGTPVIVEANLRDLYRWGSRMSVYTGLPGVTGWEWHQQQQRNTVPANWVSERIQEIDEFYLTTDPAYAENFLKKYEVEYIILGQQERGLYSLFAEQRGQFGGLDKFSALDGVLWRVVYQQADTIIYEVIDQAVAGQ